MTCKRQDAAGNTREHVEMKVNDLAAAAAAEREQLSRQLVVNLSGCLANHALSGRPADNVARRGEMAFVHGRMSGRRGLAECGRLVV